MTANAWQVYDKFYEALGAEKHNLNGVDTLKIALFTSSYSPNTATDASYSALGNEVANGNGYTTGGVTVAATWDAAAGTLTFDLADALWTASGGSITARYAVIYNSSAGGTDDIVCYALLDNTPADVVATDGNSFTVEIASTGALTAAQ